MQYVPIKTMLRALQNVGMTDIEVGKLIGLNGSNVSRLRSGETKDAKSAVYFALYALWQRRTGGKHDNDND